MHGQWRDATFAEYAKIPLENCIPLSQSLLAKPEDGGLGYAVEDLAQIPKPSVPFSGLRDIDVKVGETDRIPCSWSVWWDSGVSRCGHGSKSYYYGPG